MVKVPRCSDSVGGRVQAGELILVSERRHSRSTFREGAEEGLHFFIDLRGVGEGLGDFLA
jgi:hypothetical protein